MSAPTVERPVDELERGRAEIREDPPPGEHGGSRPPRDPHAGERGPGPGGGGDDWRPPRWTNFLTLTGLFLLGCLFAWRMGWLARARAEGAK